MPIDLVAVAELRRQVLVATVAALLAGRLPPQEGARRLRIGSRRELAQAIAAAGRARSVGSAR